MKVIRERNEEISGTSFWRQERGGAGEDLHFLLVSLALSFDELAHSLSRVLVSFLL